MKKISILIGLGFAIVTACMFYLVWKGVSLRTAPLIRPTEISPDRRNIADHLTLRLFPELQGNDYLLWGVLPHDDESQKVLMWAAEDYERTFKTRVHFVLDGEAASSMDIQNCQKPCWILMPREKAHELIKNDFIESKIKHLNKNYMSISWIPFAGERPVSEECNQQHRLQLNCLIPISIREVKKKMKDPHKLYFFLRKYQDRDYFLFVQQGS